MRHTLAAFQQFLLHAAKRPRLGDALAAVIAGEDYDGIVGKTPSSFVEHRKKKALAGRILRTSDAAQRLTALLVLLFVVFELEGAVRTARTSLIGLTREGRRVRDGHRLC